MASLVALDRTPPQYLQFRSNRTFMRLARLIWYHLKYGVYYLLFRPAYIRPIWESNQELLAMIGWIELDL
jgi:hypothetical protein